MGRKLVCLVGLVGLMLMLGGCDNCGNWKKFNVPSIPKSCHADPPAQ